MDSKREKNRRKTKRLAVPAQASCTDWEMTGHFEAMVRNHGTGGLNFGTQAAFTPGAILFVQVDRIFNVQTGLLEENRILPAEVVWCSQNSIQDPYPYSVGMKFIAPAL